MRHVVILLLPILFCSCNKAKKNNIDEHQEIIEVSDTQLAEIHLPEPSELSKSDSITLIKSWRKLMEALENSDVELLKKYSLNIINCQPCSNFPKSTFVDEIPTTQISPEIFLKFYRDSLQRKHVLQYYSNDCEIDMFLLNKKRPIEYISSKADTIEVYVVRFWNSKPPHHRQSHNFYFTKNNRTFKFFGLYL